MCAEEKEASALKHPRDREMELLLSLPLYIVQQSISEKSKRNS
jgi:hypothetical protein